MANGTLTGKELIADDVVTRIKTSHDEFKKFVATYKDFVQAINSTNSTSEANKLAQQKNQLDKQQVQLLTQITKLEKEKSNAVKAAVSAESAKLRLQKQSAGATRTNLAAYKSLNNEYQKQSRLLNDLRNRYKAIEVKKQLNITLTKKEAAEYNVLRGRVVALDAALRKTDAAAGQFQRNVGNYPKAILGTVSALKSLLGAFGLTSGIFLFASAMKDSFNRVREFDKSMQNLAGVLGETREQIEPIEKEIISVAGASIKTSREVAGLAESLATLGKRGQDLINLIQPANDLAIALQATSEDAAEFLVQTLNAFQEPTTSAQDFANTITAIRTSTSLDFQKMRDSFQYITPISKILNKDLAYTGAVVGLLADNGLKAESAGRLLGTALQKIAKEGRTLDEVLSEINEAQESGVEGYDLLALASDRFGKQAAKIGIILASNVDTLEDSAQSIRDNETALNDLVNQQLESLDAKLKILDSTWERLILTIENGSGSISNFFKGAALGITGYLEELIAVEEAQSKVFNTTGSEAGFNPFKSIISQTTFGLIDIKTEYEELVDLQREFNRYLSNVDSSTSLGFLKDEIDTLNDQIENNSDLTKEQVLLYTAQRDAVKNLYEANKTTREELEKEARAIVEATDKFDDFGRKIDVLTNEQLTDFINKNKDVAKSLGAITEEFGNDDFETLDRLKEKLSELRKTLGQTEVGTAEFSKLKSEITSLDKYIAELEGRGSSRKKKKLEDEKKVVEGTIEYYNQLITKEREIQKTEALTAAAYTESEAKIKAYQEGVDRLTGAFERLKTASKGALDYGITENPIDIYKDTILKNLEEEGFDLTSPLEELERMNQARINGETAVTEHMQAQKEKQSQIFSELFSTFAGYYRLDLTAFNDLIERKKAIEIDYAATVTSIANAVTDTKLIKYDLEAQKNKQTLDAILNDKNVSDKKKEQAQKEYDKKEAALTKKRAEAERDAILFSIAINTAQAVVKAVAESPMTGGLPYSAIALGLGLAQAAFVRSQPLPQFFKGKDERNNFEGWGTVGEKRKEVIIGGDGSIEVTPNKTTPRFINRDDIIIPSVSQFNREIKNPDSAVSNRLAKKISQDTKERQNMFVVQPSPIDTRGMEKMMERVMSKHLSSIEINVNTSNNSQPRKRYH